MTYTCRSCGYCISDAAELPDDIVQGEDETGNTVYWHIACADMVSLAAGRMLPDTPIEETTMADIEPMAWMVNSDRYGSVATADSDAVRRQLAEGTIDVTVTPLFSLDQVDRVIDALVQNAGSGEQIRWSRDSDALVDDIKEALRETLTPEEADDA